MFQSCLIERFEINFRSFLSGLKKKLTRALQLSVIRQKVKYQNGGNKKTRHAKFSKKGTFLTPSYVHVRT